MEGIDAEQAVQAGITPLDCVKKRRGSLELMKNMPVQKDDPHPQLGSPLRLSPDTAVILLGALAPSWLAMAWLVSKGAWFWTYNPELQFGWIMLLLCAYLFWEAWEVRPRQVFRWKPGAAFLGLLGCGVLGVTQLYQVAYGLTSASMSGLAMGTMFVVTANLCYVFGWRGVRHFAFAFAFILFALPIPSVIYNPIVIGLQSKVAGINVEVLNVIGIPAEQAGSLIRLPNGTVGVDEACSGIRSLQSTLMATLFIGYVTLRTKSLQVTLLIVGLALAILGNLVRSLFLTYTANAQGLSAIERFHDVAGWSILLFTAAGVAGVAFLLGKTERSALRRLRVHSEETPAELVCPSQKASKSPGAITPNEA